MQQDQILLENKRDGQFEIANDFVLAMTGYHPDYEFLRTLGIEVEESGDGEPACDPDSLETNMERIYVAGVIQCGLKTHRLFNPDYALEYLFRAEMPVNTRICSILDLTVGETTVPS